LIGDVGTLPGWQRGSLIDDLQAGLNLPVVIENDADAAVLGEARWGSDATSGSFVYKECGRAEAGVLAFRG
jgi:predicted NBD/HSP70 family sugar kinase